MQLPVEVAQQIDDGLVGNFWRSSEEPPNHENFFRHGQAPFAWRRFGQLVGALQLLSQLGYGQDRKRIDLGAWSDRWLASRSLPDLLSGAHGSARRCRASD